MATREARVKRKENGNDPLNEQPCKLVEPCLYRDRGGPREEWRGWIGNRPGYDILRHSQNATVVTLPQSVPFHEGVHLSDATKNPHREAHTGSKADEKPGIIKKHPVTAAGQLLPPTMSYDKTRKCIQECIRFTINSVGYTTEEEIQDVKYTSTISERNEQLGTTFRASQRRLFDLHYLFFHMKDDLHES